MIEPARPFDRALADRYAIERTLGQGGMASVYLAEDLKHHRKVAIKVLRPELAAALGADRFLREIEIAAKLNHPHILALYDSGTADGFFFYVMPHITGESLRQTLDRERQLSIDDALRITTQVASALDYAHAQGLLHRDIKPENILLHEREALVADFGIALAMSAAATERMTATGVWLGTPEYVSPEQATGERTLDARSDVYSLACVCYEMLAGEPPYAGKAQALIVKHVVDPVPAVRRLRDAVPAGVEQALMRALAKAPADRFASAGEFAEALAKGVADARILRSVGGRPFVTYALIALAIVVSGAAIWGWIRPAPSKGVVRYALMVDSTQAIAITGTSWSGRLALSPDGSRLAYIGGPRRQLLVRPRNQLRAIAVPGTEGVATPFFSPDGDQVGFLREEEVQFAPVTGGPAVTVTDSLTGVSGASWGPDGFIYVDGSGVTSLLRVEAKPAARPTWFTVLDTARGEFDHTWPEVLPNGKGVLFTVAFTQRNAARGRTSYAIAVADIPSGKHRVIVDDAMYARYAMSGHLLYVTTNKTLMVVPFDENSMKVRGEPAALSEGMRLGLLGSADLAVSATGTLVYATGAGRGEHELVWVTRDGRAEAVDPAWQGGFVGFPALSPDGKALAVARGASAEFTHIWIKGMDRGPSIKLTLEGDNVCPAWTPDGRSVTFSSDAAGGVVDLWTKRADGSAQAVLQVHEKRNLYAAIWSPNGEWLVFQTDPQQLGAGDILGIRPGIDSVPAALVASKFTEIAPALSPDGRWLAYTSNETGEDEIYVVPFPNTGTAKWAISTGGGTEPLWSHRGSELFYRDASENLVAVEVKTKPTFSLGHSTTLFPAVGFFSFRFDPQYAVAPNDSGFLMIRPREAGAPDELIVVENWFEELTAKARK